MAELNGSNYYRANPFYQQGYIPDIAFKNRKLPSYMVEIPQGNQYFEPTNKKHFQRVGYYSTIGDEHIMDHDPSTSPSRDRLYFRNLNVEDIEGASTNSLISKAVKNRQKAKEYLAEKERSARQEESRSRVQKIQQQYEQKRRLEALAKMKGTTEPNYHEKVMKMRTQQVEQSPYSPSIPKQEEKIPQKPQYQNYYSNSRENQYRFQNQLENSSYNYHNKQYDHYRKELEKTEKQIRQLESQLQQSRHRLQQKEEKSNSNHQAQKIVNQPLSSFNRQEDLQKMIVPETYQRRNQYLQHQRKLSGPQHQFEMKYSQKDNYTGRVQQLVQKQQRNQPGDVRNYRNYSGMLEPYNKVRSNSYQPYNGLSYQQKRQPEPKRTIQSPIYNQREQNKQTREQHRRFNPTYLSYGSAAIGLAGRNIVGS